MYHKTQKFALQSHAEFELPFPVEVPAHRIMAKDNVSLLVLPDVTALVFIETQIMYRSETSPDRTITGHI